MTPEKLHSLGFKENPFLISSDPRFLYLSTQHQMVTDRAKDVVEWREGLAVIEGPLGVGKSTVARYLYNIFAFQPGYQAVYIHTAEYSTKGQAAQDIARALGVREQRAYISQMRRLEEHLVAKREADDRVVVVLDDVQKMKPPALEVFQSLFNFDVNVKLIQIFLFAKPEIHSSFAQHPDLVDRVMSWQKLSPLAPDDALNLVLHRSKVAGRDRPLLTDSAFFTLYEFTRGVPRKIVIVCAETLRVLAQNGKQVADEQDVEAGVNAYQARLASGATLEGELEYA